MTALSQALQPPFEVDDSDGFTVGTGVVNGEVVPVPQGRYTVVVDTSPSTTIDEVVVKPGETTEVVLGGGYSGRSHFGGSWEALVAFIRELPIEDSSPAINARACAPPCSCRCPAPSTGSPR